MTHKDLINKAAEYVRDVEVLTGGIDHTRPYNQQLNLLQAIQQAKFGFQTTRTEIEAYADRRLNRLNANRVRFLMNEWAKKIDR